MGPPPSAWNGWTLSKRHSHGRRVNGGSKGKRERMMENGVSDEYGRWMQPPSQHPHQRPATHQSLQVHGVPHHHHFMHRHGAHHHHLPGHLQPVPSSPLIHPSFPSCSLLGLVLCVHGNGDRGRCGTCASAKGSFPGP